MPSTKSSTPPRKRNHALYATTAGVVNRITFVTNTGTGAVEIVEADPDSYRSVIYHERESGKDKVLLDGRASPHINAFDAHAQFMGTFRYALGVDTNMRRGDGFALACVFVVPGLLNPNASKVRIELLNAFVIIDPSPAVDPERIGWYLTIRENILPGRFDPNGQIALVTDSALDQLPRINARKAAYYEGHVLPPNVSLVYASADKPTRTIPSALIRACETYAKSLAKEVRTRGHAELSPGDQNFRGWYSIAPDRATPSASRPASVDR